MLISLSLPLPFVVVCLMFLFVCVEKGVVCLYVFGCMSSGMRTHFNPPPNELLN